MDTVSEHWYDKISTRRDTPFVVVPFPVGIDEIGVTKSRISVSNDTTAASSCVHYEVSRIVLYLRGVDGKGMKTE